MLPMAEHPVNYGPTPIVPPWNKPYSEWTRIQLDAGLVACAEFGWQGNEQHIREEIADRDRKYKGERPDGRAAEAGGKRARRPRSSSSPPRRP